MKGIVIIGSLIIVLSLFSSLSEARTSYGFVTSDGTIISGSGDYTTSAASNCNNDVCGVLYNISFTTPYTKTPVATANGHCPIEYPCHAFIVSYSNSFVIIKTFRGKPNDPTWPHLFFQVQGPL